MAAQFYARYVPPASSPKNTPQNVSFEAGTARPSKKRKLGGLNGELSPLQSSNTQNHGSSAATHADDDRVTAPPKLVSQGSRSNANGLVKEAGGYEAENSQQGVRKEEKKKKKKKNKEALKKSRIEDVGGTARPAETHATEESDDAKHQGVRDKYARSKQIGAKLAERQKRKENKEQTEQDAILEKVEAEGLQPLPQPAEVSDSNLRSTIQALPGWLAKPTFVKGNATIAFSELGLSEHVIQGLLKQGYEKAFAIQATVLRLLLPGPARHRGDICVAAATGSGKSLAYTIPIIEALRNKPVRRLRAVIVVPTRELVDQARDIFHQLDSGLEIGVAVGSKSLREERETFIKKDWSFDPEEYRAAQLREIEDNSWNWLDESSDEDEKDDPLAELPNLVPTYLSKIDVLICTPGRLVDHMRNTKGFTLEHVQWLIIDEADKLLDQSFQQWVELVIPALEQSMVDDSYVIEDYILPRRPCAQKVVLSATMGKDLDQLESLNLYRPTLVALEGENLKAAGHETDRAVHASDAVTVLPARLAEYAVAVREVGDKPLYLVQLIEESLLNRKQFGESGLTRLSPSDSVSSASDTTSAEDNTSSEDESLSNEDASSSLNEDSETSSSASSTEFRNATAREPSLLYGMLVFTNTNENALRLCRLLCLLQPSLADKAAPLTKSSGTAAGRRTLASFRKRKIYVIVASERASRGLDLRSLAHVVNYDMPSSLTSYVHRIGRTARAGKDGMATTLVAHHEARWFWNEIARSSKIERARKVARKEVQLMDISGKDREAYELALEQLGKETKGHDQ